MLFSISTVPKRPLLAGFTVSKFLIIFSILVLLAIMLFPSYLNVRFAENENNAKGNLRIFYEAAELYRKISSPPDYPEGLQALSETDLPLVDPKLLFSKKQGYQYEYVRGGMNKFHITAVPIQKFLTGYRTFYVDQTGIIRLNHATGEPIDS
jgi:hypothetical protein